METKKLVEKLNEIKMPKEMQERIIRNCYVKMEEKTMSKNTTKNFFKRPMVAVASLTLCVCLTSVTALAATGKLKGFFKDITRWDGAVIGTTYEQATDEIDLSVVAVADELTLEVSIVNPNVVPYATFELFGIESYEIADMNGNVVFEGETTELVEIVDGKANIVVPLEGLTSGNYKLVVSELVGSAKADQPLVVRGNWECDFSINNFD